MYNLLGKMAGIAHGLRLPRVHEGENNTRSSKGTNTGNGDVKSFAGRRIGQLSGKMATMANATKQGTCQLPEVCWIAVW